MPDMERKQFMKREKSWKLKEQSSKWSMFIAILLLVLMVPSVAADAAREGTLTIQRFRVEDYENLRESTGQSSDMTNVPTDAQTMEGIAFQVEKLLVSATATDVTTDTAVDSTFQARVQSTDAQGRTRFTGLPEGYYLVTERSQSGHLAQGSGRFVVKIPNTVIDASGNETTDYDVVVYPKGQSIQVEKNAISTRQVVGVGDLICWEVWYPMGEDLKREETINGVTTTRYGKNFYLTDEMDSRLDAVIASIRLRYYDRDKEEINLTLTQDTDYHLNYDENTHILKISFTDDVGTKKVADADVAYIQMHLHTRVNTSALDTVEVLWNNARIFFENASGDPYEHEVFPPGTNPEDSRVPKVHLGEIAITKVDAQDTTVRLAGATFSIATTLSDAQAGKFLTREIDASGTREEITITTDSNGQASIKAIGSGIYYLVETQAPEGYAKLTEPIEVTVVNQGDRNVVQVEIRNQKDGSIPGTPGDDKPGDGEPGDTEPGKPGEQPGTPSGDQPGTDGSGSGGKGFAGGVKTGDVVRMTGILLLMTASVGMIGVYLRRREMKKIEVRDREVENIDVQNINARNREVYK